MGPTRGSVLADPEAGDGIVTGGQRPEAVPAALAFRLEHVVRRPDHAVAVVERKEALEEILLVPVHVHVENEAARVFLGQEDVVPMDQCARLQVGNHLRELEEYVAANHCHVCRIDEQQVAVQDLGQVHVLYALLDKATEAGQAPLQLPRGKGLHGHEFDRMTLLCIAQARRRRDHGRLPTADLDHLRGLMMADHAVVDERIHLRHHLAGGRLELGKVPDDYLLQVAALPLHVHLDARERLDPSEEVVWQVFRVGNRVVVMHGR